MLEMEKEVIALKVLSTMHSVASRCGSFRLQAQITSLRGESEHFEMELKLREMLEEELEKELTDARLKNQVQPVFIAGLSGSNNAIALGGYDSNYFCEHCPGIRIPQKLNSLRPSLRNCLKLCRVKKSRWSVSASESLMT